MTEQEILEIIDRHNVEVWGIDGPNTAKDIRKLFLTKQIELLEEVSQENLDDIRAFISLQIHQIKEEIKHIGHE